MTTLDSGDFNLEFLIRQLGGTLDSGAEFCDFATFQESGIPEKGQNRSGGPKWSAFLINPLFGNPSEILVGPSPPLTPGAELA